MELGVAAIRTATQESMGLSGKPSTQFSETHLPPHVEPEP